MTFSIAGQEKSDILPHVTAQAGLTVLVYMLSGPFDFSIEALNKTNSITKHNKRRINPFTINGRWT